jgi:Flp pilus assembly pilin Flp
VRAVLAGLSRVACQPLSRQGDAMSRLLQWFGEEDGPVGVEYAVLLGLIIAVCIGSITLVGGGTANFWSNNQSELERALGD